MVLAVVVLSIVSNLSYHWLTQPILTSADVTQFSGTIKQARVLSGKSACLEITLDNQPHPFRCFSRLYPSAFKYDLKGRLRVGEPVSLGVATSEASTPRRNWVQNQQFFEFITMSIRGFEYLPLDGHNKSVESDKKLGPWFCLVMAMMSCWLFRIGYIHRASSDSIIAILEAEKTEIRW